ncbi:MAG: universal stress protein [Chloroflexota bacterium]
MIANILVPLDGSARAERALPVAASVAHATGARLWLVHALPAMPPLIDREQGVDAFTRLDALAARLREGGLDATARTIHGDAANVILDAVADMRADLIVMSTHGLGGLGRWLYGSVADQLLARATVPVLLIPAACDRPLPEGRPTRILVPLDGSDRSEAALGPARDLGQAIGADLLLLRVVEQKADFVWQLDPIGVAMRAAKAEDLAVAREYLDGIAAPPGPSERPVDLLVDEGDPASVIPRIARQEEVDLIVMATHGRTGLARLTMGSVATTTVHRSHVPIVLVRPPGLEQPH